MGGRRFAKRAKAAVLVACLVVVASAIMVPFCWMIITSVRPRGEMFGSRATLIPKRITLSHYEDLLLQTQFIRWIANSVFVAGGAVLLGVFMCSLAGFAFAKYRFRGKEILLGILMGSISIPQIVTIIPVFAIMSRIGWIDSYQVLILPAASSALGILFMRAYIGSVPSEIIDAGRVDGCNDFQIYYRLILPVVKPGLAALAIIIFLDSWLSYLWPLIMIRTPDMFTLPLGVASLYANPWVRDYGMIMAAATISTLPMLVVYLLMRRDFVAGLTYGAVK